MKFVDFEETVKKVRVAHGLAGGACFSLKQCEASVFMQHRANENSSPLMHVI